MRDNDEEKEVYTSSSNRGETTLLVLGIVGLALSSTGVPGLFVSSIAFCMAESFTLVGYRLKAMGRVGKALAKAGIIVGLVFTVLFVAYFLSWEALAG